MTTSIAEPVYVQGAGGRTRSRAAVFAESGGRRQYIFPFTSLSVTLDV